MSNGKYCSECGVFKLLDEFYKASTASKDGYRNQCKSCLIIKTGIRRKIRNKTKKGLISSIYTDQIQSSKKRNHPPPEYTLQELIIILPKNPTFNKHYNIWVASGYKSELRPSIDRKDNSIGYTKANVKITNWKINNANEGLTIKNGTDTKRLKPVNQYTLDGRFIRSHYSISEAQRKTGIDTGGISRACKNPGYTAGGYKWEYA